MEISLSCLPLPPFKSIDFFSSKKKRSGAGEGGDGVARGRAARRTLRSGSPLPWETVAPLCCLSCVGLVGLISVHWKI